MFTDDPVQILTDRTDPSISPESPIKHFFWIIALK